MTDQARHADVERIVDLLGLKPHPEGGFFRETFRSSQVFGDATGNQHRSALTAIYFLLPAGAFSAFHLIRGADEVWHHYGGGSVEIHTITANGDHRVAVLGGGLAQSERPQVVVPRDTLQAAFARGTNHALCGCTVAPGFDFADFALPARDELLGRFPQHGDVIRIMKR